MRSHNKSRQGTSYDGCNKGHASPTPVNRRGKSDHFQAAINELRFCRKARANTVFTHCHGEAGHES